MEESTSSTIADGEVIAIQFGLASHREILRSSISDCPISHASQLANPFLGLPLEIGKCESCGTAEPGQCEGHFGYIELPIPVYHPSHISELRRMLTLICLKCLKLKTNKPTKTNGVMERLLSSCCEETSRVSIKESKTNDGAHFLELRLPARDGALGDSWSFLERYGYRYGDGISRILLPTEVEMILKKLSVETRKKLAKKGYFPQDGYILHYLPVPPNCLSVPDISDGVSVMSSDLSSAMMKKVLRQIEVIRSSRSGDPNFESHEVEANELQIAVLNYLQVRGTGKAAREADNRYGVSKEGSNSSTKAWLAKMRTLFISKGSGFSSRSVITGDAYRHVDEVGLPSEIAQKMTFEERVSMHNIQYLQDLVDKNLCLTFRDGSSTYSLREGSKGHTFLKLGQIVHRRIMDGDIVFINRPPTTHKHSLQALRVYIHDDHTVKINPLMCGPLAADFDGDCVHLFYPQSLAARAEVVELFSVEKQLLSSHSGNLNLQLAADSLLSLKTMFKNYFLDKASAQQLVMYASNPLPPPAVLKANAYGPRWTALQVLQAALPSGFNCQDDKLVIRGSEVVKLDFNRDVMAGMINEILTSLFFNKSPKDALNFLDSLQPLLMENLFVEGFSVGLNDFFIPKSELENIQSQIQDISPLLFQLRSCYNELIQIQFESYIRLLKVPIANFILTSSALGNLFDSRSESAVEKVVQQIGFLGLQLSDRRKFYSKGLVEDVASLFHQKYPLASVYPSEEFGLVKGCFFHGLDPYEGMVHSIATREIIVRSSKGLAEPGTLFKNLMAILRDVVICYDGTVRNISSNSVIQFEYGVGGLASQQLFPAGEPVGVLAATAMSNPAYKAVLDSSPSSNSAWDMMKEILFCRVNFVNGVTDRRVILYLNDCDCGRKHCQENASYVVKNHLQKVSLRDAAVEFLIEYKHAKSEPGSAELERGLVGHIHLKKDFLHEANISIHQILQKCEDEVASLRKKKKYGYYFKTINLSVSDCCFFEHSSGKWSNMPCVKFFWPDLTDTHLEKMSHIMADMICPMLLDTVIKGDPRISTVNIIWISPNTITWVPNPRNDSKGELAVEVTLEKAAVRQNGDAWRIVMDCCLQVFHLIDTSRSIPYAIKQIQDLFGISCAFDQVVQRLSTSVTSVTKGVLKEHLLLLASSMTCAGNLIGFNTSGIKGLCRALSVQVPFTEATLYTPRKCFERASEKCHVDSLSSIVASCAWGKRVAVGTGAKFDILWDNQEAGIDDKPIDVYNFLQLVRGSNEEEMVGTDCLGEDLDRYDWDDTLLEPALSPEPENKAVFEDMVEDVVDTQGQAGSSWDVPSNAGTSSWDLGKGQRQEEVSGWGPKKDQAQQEKSPDAGGWSNPGSKKDQTQEEHTGGWNSSKMAEPSSNWGKTVKEASNAGSDWSNQTERADSGKEPWGKPSNTSGAWTAEKTNEQSGSGSWNSQKKDNNMQQPSWGKPTVTSLGPDKGDADDTTWGSKKSNQSSGPQEWGSKPAGGDSSKGWGSNKEEGKTQSGSGSWNSQKKDNNTQQPSWGKPTVTSLGPDKGDADGTTWGSKKSNQSSGPQEWGSKPASGDSSKGWGSKKEEGKTQSSWGVPGDSPQKKPTQSAGQWGSKKSNEDGGSDSQGWASRKEEPKTQSSWGAPIPPSDSSLKNTTQTVGEWDSKKSAQSNSPVGWGSTKSTQNGKGESGTEEWGSKKQDSKSPTWGAPSGNNSGQSGDAWGSKKPGQPISSPLGWGSSNSSQKKESETGSQGWGSKKEETKNPSSWGAPIKQTLNNPTKGASEWNSMKPAQTGSPHGWGSSTNPSQKDESASGSKGWGAKKEDTKTTSSWGAPINSTSNNSNQGAGEWDSKKPGQTSSPLGWGSSANPSHKDEKASGSNGWGSIKEDTKTASTWGAPIDSSSKNPTESLGEWDMKKSTQPSSPLGWGSSAKVDANASEPQGSQGWGSQQSNAGNEGNSQSPWGQPGDKRRRPEGGRGWGASNSGEWKNRKNLPRKQPGAPNENTAGVGYTTTRKRLDLFGTEEQDALLEAEAVMQACRRIMHQAGYTDGEPLPAEDQSYIVDNVLNYHPDKAAKMGAGVDYITVKKHSNFQESRCLYVVSTDGETVDFSYFKCLENLIRQKHSSVADSFIAKYFNKRANRQPESATP